MTDEQIITELRNTHCKGSDVCRSCELRVIAAARLQALTAVPPQASPLVGEVQVRIAVCLYKNAWYDACGITLHRDEDAAFRTAKIPFMEEVPARYIVTANLPLPSVVEVAGVVEDEKVADFGPTGF